MSITDPVSSRWLIRCLLVSLLTFGLGTYLGLRWDTLEHAIGSRRGYYLPNAITVFYKLAVQEGTDKVTSHPYEDVYSKYFELMPRRDTIQKLFEIGLGCTMDYGPGASTKLWRRYLTQAEIWQAEYNAECVQKAKDKLDAQNVKFVTGDQSDTDTLKRWIEETGGEFDVIIDDGGHTNMQQFNSFLVLFEHALRPGGLYVLEDIQISRSWVDGDKHHIMIDVVKEWMEGLVMVPRERGNVYKPKFGLPPGIKTIDCSQGVCVFTKCYRNDKRCHTPATDTALAQYSMQGTGLLTGGK